jgi:hypothetical protein
MYLVQILLPVYGNDGKPLAHDAYSVIRDELVGRFGGLTAFTQSPAEGLWTTKDQRTERDDIIMIEVMVDELDKSWWASYRERLQIRLKQVSVVIRALLMERL